MNYVYIRPEFGIWTVGCHDANVEWISLSDHTSEEEAIERVSLLNGSIGLRDRFAIAALQGEIASQFDDESHGWYGEANNHNTLAKRCYMIADAMMLARNAQEDAK